MESIQEIIGQNVVLFPDDSELEKELIKMKKRGYDGQGNLIDFYFAMPKGNAIDLFSYRGQNVLINLEKLYRYAKTKFVFNTVIDLSQMALWVPKPDYSKCDSKEHRYEIKNNHVLQNVLAQELTAFEAIKFNGETLEDYALRCDTHDFLEGNGKTLIKIGERFNYNLSNYDLVGRKNAERIGPGGSLLISVGMAMRVVKHLPLNPEELGSKDLVKSYVDKLKRASKKSYIAEPMRQLFTKTLESLSHYKNLMAIDGKLRQCYAERHFKS